MKRTKIFYWIFTILFTGFMTMSALPDFFNTPDAVTFMTHLGYPPYFTPFIGFLKLLGVIAVLIPAFPRVKEWAYAGLFFDLMGATYSMIAVEGIKPQMSFMLLPLIFLFLSYGYWYKMRHYEKSTAHAALS